MKIDFRAKYYTDDNILPISLDTQDYHISILQSFYSQLSTNMELSALETIIIPNNFKSELITFQREHDLQIGFTDNDVESAIAKVITHTDNDKIKKSIFFHKALLPALQDDHTINNSLLGENEKNELIIKRQDVINILHHEMAHIHEDALSNGIYNNNDLSTTNSIFERLKDITIILWKEYFACRFSSETYLFNYHFEENVLGLMAKIKEIEEKITIRKNNKFSDISGLTTEIELLAFRIMRDFSYFQGHINFTNDSEEKYKIIIEIGKILDNTIFSDVWITMNIYFDVFYKKYNKHTANWVFDKLERTIRDCWNNLYD
ncbi:hypothetical protein [Desulfosporosinus sp.]|uniref:hypothetical protein n=1 Tax=Desulfosporosinus sp. TaxID=157907 RepID=UPI002616851E|nr:hypothetical protein [Desulfosporosinus sp.]